MNTLLLKGILCAFLISLIAANVKAQGVAGVWRTIDDKTGKDKSHVEISIVNGRLYGKVVKILDTSKGENPLCSKCEGSLKNMPIIGMQIIGGLERSGKEWYKKKGVFDAENGKYYDVKIWLKDKNTLRIRGYLGMIYRTQEWKRVI